MHIVAEKLRGGRLPSAATPLPAKGRKRPGPPPVFEAGPFTDLTGLRFEAARRIEALLAFLDATEPDADLEPSLGSVAPRAIISQDGWAQGGSADLEDEFDGREADEDAELTAPETGYKEQCLYSEVPTLSKPLCDDLEEDPDSEPDLAAPEPDQDRDMSQIGWCRGGCTDGEANEVLAAEQ